MPYINRTGSWIVLLWLAGLAAAEDRFAWAASALSADNAPLVIAVDTRELPERGLVHSRIRIALAPGEALRFPRWVPGVHAPGGPIQNLGGLRIRTTDGDAIAWRRDPLDTWRFHLDLPAGGPRVVECDLTYIANQPTANSVGIDVLTGDGWFALNWNTVLLYRDGRPVADQTCVASLRLPQDWSFASALLPRQVATTDPDVVHFTPLSLARLVDNPVIGGRACARRDLGEPAAPVTVHVCGPTDAAVSLHPRWLTGLNRLPAEAEALFGGAFYDRYAFLVLSGPRGMGLEHRCCSLNGVPTAGLIDPAQTNLWQYSLLPHEYLHSWIGKHRRPHGMWTPNYHTPKNCEGLWIYEGLTQYYGTVLAARTGMITPDEWRDYWAETFDDLMHTTGRHWRSIRDTCRSSFHLRGGSRHHGRLRRNQDYYLEGGLFWFVADLHIRQASDGERSLDDFCAAFFGPAQPVGAFTEDELVSALGRLAAIDWAAMIARRIDGMVPELDPRQIEPSGWRFSSQQVALADLTSSQYESVASSIGLQVQHGWIKTVAPDSPAHQAGLRSGDYIHAVNGIERQSDPLYLARALDHSPVLGHILLHVHRDGAWTTRRIAYAGGIHSQGMVRIPDTPDRLSAILTPRTWEPQPDSNPVPEPPASSPPAPASSTPAPSTP